MSDEFESDVEVDEVDDEEEEEEEEESEDEAAKKKRKGKKWKDPNKPKRAMSAFFLYSQAFRQQVKEDNPDASFGEVARILSAQYKALPEKETKKWAKKAEQEKSRYQDEMKDYIPIEGEGGKKKKTKKDPNAPKRNMSAYFLYSTFIRSTVKEENPSASFGDIARIISAQYKGLPDKEKKKWEKKAGEDKERYQKEMVKYNAWL